MLVHSSRTCTVLTAQGVALTVHKDTKVTWNRKIQQQPVNSSSSQMSYLASEHSVSSDVSRVATKLSKGVQSSHPGKPLHLSFGLLC